MDAQTLNDIVSQFVQTLDAGTATLGQYSIGILALAATLAFYVQLMPQLASGGAGVGDALAGFLLLVIKIGIVYWIILYLPDLARAAFDTFAQWGGAAGGTRADFLNPGAIVDTGFRVARPIRTFTDNVWIWLSRNPAMLISYSLAYYAIVIAFGLVALAMMLTIIEFHLAVMAGAVLMPWGIFPALAFLSEASVGWITGGLVRVLLTAAMVGVGVPLFQGLKLTFSSGGDPTFYSGLVCGLTCLIFAVLTWTVPARGGNLAGRGVALVLGSDVIAGAASGARWAMLGGGLVRGAVQGTSSLVQGVSSMPAQFRAG
jgi:type IV secretion system protein TrbL